MPLSESMDNMIPKVGTRWIWSIDSSYARTLCEVTEVRWNGEEWWVWAAILTTNAPIGDRDVPDRGKVHPNELDDFWVAATPVGGRVEDLCEPAPDVDAAL